jgi:hypothetical protein
MLAIFPEACSGLPIISALSAGPPWGRDGVLTTQKSRASFIAKPPLLVAGYLQPRPVSVILDIASCLTEHQPKSGS